MSDSTTVTMFTEARHILAGDVIPLTGLATDDAQPIDQPGGLPRVSIPIDIPGGTAIMFPLSDHVFAIDREDPDAPVIEAVAEAIYYSDESHTEEWGTLPKDSQVRELTLLAARSAVKSYRRASARIETRRATGLSRLLEGKEHHHD